MSLEAFLRSKADALKPAEDEWGSADGREYVEHVNPDALTEAWLDNGTSYIWKVGMLAQWDSNKCDWAYLFIGHEREPGRMDFIGMLEWPDGENDDIGRCIGRYNALRQTIRHPVFSEDDHA